MHKKYDKQNIFAKIIRGEIPAKKIYEDEVILAFHDAFPVAKIHILVIPKAEYIDFPDFISKATETEIAYFFKKVSEIANSLNLDNGYRIVANTGKDSGQSVFHFHTHIIAGTNILNREG